MKKEKILNMTWRKFFILIISFVLAVILHNIFYAIFGFEEAVFFTIATIIIPLYLAISIIYTLIPKLSKRKNNG